MAEHITDSTTFSQALSQALTQEGVGLLTQPDRLLEILKASVESSPALDILSQNCTVQVLAPFEHLARQATQPTDAQLEEAMTDTEVYLVQERNLDPSEAHVLSMQLARGISAYRSTSSPKPPSWRRRLPLIAAVLVALVMAAVVVDLATRIPVHFVGNGSTSGSMSDERVRKDSSLELPNCSFERTDYQFLGWELGERVYQPGEEITVSHEVTMRAVWGVLVTFDGNGGSGSMDELAADRDGNLVLPTCTFTNSRYGFVGWSRKKDAFGNSSATLFDAGDSVQVDEPTTYYATWAPRVFFNGGGGTGSMDSLVTSASGTITLPDNEYKHKGYRFAGWSPSSSGTPIKAGTVVTLDEPTTYYAIWRPRAYFDANGGSGTMKSKAANKNGKVTLPESEFTRSGYRFAGWATSTTGSPTSPGKTVSVSEPTTYYAIWRAVVSFDGNGADSGSTASVVAGDNGLATLPSCGFSRKGYVFEGWGTSAAATSFYKAGDRVSAKEPDTYYALWKLDPSIGEKVDGSCVFKSWETGGASLFVYLTNNAPIPLGLQVTFTYLDGQGNELDETSDVVTALAPGETTLVIGTSKKSGIQRINYTSTVSAVDEGYEPLQSHIRVTESSCSVGKLVLNITNTSSKAVTIRRVIAYGYNSYGGEAQQTQYPNGHLNAGESLQVTYESFDGFDPDWPSYRRSYYVDGYAK